MGMSKTAEETRFLLLRIFLPQFDKRNATVVADSQSIDDSVDNRNPPIFGIDIGKTQIANKRHFTVMHAVAAFALAAPGDSLIVLTSACPLSEWWVLARPIA